MLHVACVVAWPVGVGGHERKAQSAGMPSFFAPKPACPRSSHSHCHLYRDSDSSFGVFETMATDTDPRLMQAGLSLCSYRPRHDP